MTMEKRISPDRFKILSGSMLKLIAIITMLIDHAALVLAPQIPLLTVPFVTIAAKEISLYFLMRKIGRLAFPIFCFLVTEGFAHTKNKKRYAISLLLFALISEIPFNMLNGGQMMNLKTQNIFFTLFLGVMMLTVFEYVRKELFRAILFIGIGIIAVLVKSDYGLKGVLLILLMYLLKNRPAVQAVLSYPLLSGGVAAFAAFVPINMYNGQRGFIKSPVMKYAFYLFYPVHIVLLIGIKHILM